MRCHRDHRFRQPNTYPVAPSIRRHAWLEVTRAQRRRGDREAVGLAVPPDRRRLLAAEVALATAAVDRRVGVESLGPPAAGRNPDPVIVARDRSEIEGA